MGGKDKDINKNQKDAPLFEAVKEFAGSDVTPFFIPGHKLGSGVDEKLMNFAGANLFRMDLSEVNGTDDLHHPQSSILRSQELAARAWGADETFFLVNGTSCGIIAAVCTVAGPGEKVIVPRNVHKSVIYGLVLSGATPVYVTPRIDAERGLAGSLDPAEVEKALHDNSGVKGVLMVSPTYHGVVSDVASVAATAHSRGVPLIVDEAHGAHLRFSERLPGDAISAGADISVQSTHKMAGSLGQSSMLHVKSELVDMDRLRANISMVQSTSPSYVLLSSLDAARRNMALNGARIFDEILDLLDAARSEIGALRGAVMPGVDGSVTMGVGKALTPDAGDAITMDAGWTGTLDAGGTVTMGASEAVTLDVGEVVTPGAGENAVYAWEPMRIVFGFNGMEGYRLFSILRGEYNIEAEFADSRYVVCVAGAGTKPEHIAGLVQAAKGIAIDYSSEIHPGENIRSLPLPTLPPMEKTPREAWFAAKANVTWKDAEGRVSGEMIVPYPPGVPAVCPGEVITPEIWSFLDELRKQGCRFHGVIGDGLEEVRVLDV